MCVCVLCARRREGGLNVISTTLAVYLSLSWVCVYWVGECVEGAREGSGSAHLCTSVQS